MKPENLVPNLPDLEAGEIDGRLPDPAPEQAHTQGWQPISSAPLNKTTVALLHASQSGTRHYGVGWYMPMDCWRGWDYERNGKYMAPTHWYPLPEPPQT